MTREQWLEKATEHMRSGMFKRVGETVPAVRVSVGIPKGRGTAIGQCWNGAASADGLAQVFISPKLDDAARVLDVLAHELIHAVKPEAGHGAAFKRIALAIGLTGKMTATVAGPTLKAELDRLAGELGAYPHARLDFDKGGPKKQGTRLLKAECDGCGYNVRVTRKWLDEVGAPICPRDERAMEVA
jgi:hypothetical protein